MKITLKQLKNIIKEEITKNARGAYVPQIGGSSEILPFATVKKMWLQLSGGEAPDGVEPQQHEEFIATIAGQLNVDENKVRDIVVDWGTAMSLGGLSKGSNPRLRDQENRSALRTSIQKTDKEPWR